MGPRKQTHCQEPRDGKMGYGMWLRAGEWACWLRHKKPRPGPSSDHPGIFGESLPLRPGAKDPSLTLPSKELHKAACSANEHQPGHCGLGVFLEMIPSLTGST